MKLWKIVGLMICLSILVAMPVSALETLQDDIVAPSSYISANYNGATGATYRSFGTLRVYHIEATAGTSALIHFDTAAGDTTYLAGAPNATYTSFVATIGADVVGEGEIGYQRSFSATGVELPGYQYLVFSMWDPGTYAGTQDVTITWSIANCPMSQTLSLGSWTTTPPTGYMVWRSVSDTGGSYTLNKHFAFENSYSATKGVGLGIVGTIWKYSLAHGDIYPSQAFVINATGNNQVVASQSIVSGDSLHFNIPTESIYIAVLDPDGTWHNTSSMFSVAAPTASSYSILVNPTTLTLPGTVSGSLIASSVDLAKVTDISWDWTDATGSYDFNEGGNTSRPLDYTKVGTTWWGYERGAGGIGGAYSRSKGTTFPNPVTLSNVSSSGLKLVACFIGTSDGYWYSLTADLTVAQGGMQTLVLEATDAKSNALVGYTDFAVLDKTTSLWSNVTASGGTYNYLFPYNSNLYIEAIATEYGRATKNWTVLPYPSYILKIPMYQIGTVAATNVSLNVVVLDGSTSGVFPNVQVRLSDGQVRSTSGAGVATFTTLAAKSYQIIASYSGYSSATRTVTTGTGGTSQDTYLTLNRIVVTTAPTLPPGVTAVVTLDTRTNAQKDLDMMNQIREYAPMLITLAMLMTMMYLVGYKP